MSGMKYKCAVIGLGRIGVGFDDIVHKKSVNTHVGAYLANKNTELIALCDIDGRKLIKYGKKYGINNLYTDYRQLFRSEDLDCVSICTHADSHLELVREAAKFNVSGIFLEKPISNTLENARKIIEICSKKKIKLQINHQRRFDPNYQKVRRLITSGKFGKIQHVDVYYGSGIANTGSHIFDLLRFFFGNAKWVSGAYSSNLSNYPKDPNINGIIVWKNGIECSLHSFNFNYYLVLELDLIGSKARLRLNLGNGKVNYFKSSKRGLVYSELVEEKYASPSVVSPIVLGLRNLLCCIERNAKPLCGGEDGYLSLELIVSMLQSSEKGGKRINLPLKTNKYKIFSK